jgi:AAA+ ATPase superfamily predicted ATPase
MTVNIVDREQVLKKLHDGLTQTNLKVHYALIGHRRIGKTVILGELQKQLATSGLIVASVDFSKYGQDPIEFGQALFGALTEAYRETLDPTSRVFDQVKHAVGEIKKLKRMRVVFDLTVDETGKPVTTMRPALAEERPRYPEAFEKPFEYASRLAAVSGKKVVMIIDEAQKITQWSKLEGMGTVMDQFRAIIDTLGDVAIVVCGSRVHMLKSIFGEEGSPLFGRFTIVEVGPLEQADASTLYLRSAPAADADEFSRVYALVGGHPFYLIVMAEARMQNETAEDRYKRLLTDVTGGLYLYVNYLLSEDLGSKIDETNYVRILRSLAGGEKRVSEIAKDTGLKLVWLPRYLTKLIDYDLVDKLDGTYRLKDRIVADYFRFKYPEDYAAEEAPQN